METKKHGSLLSSDSKMQEEIENLKASITKLKDFSRAREIYVFTEEDVGSKSETPCDITGLISLGPFAREFTLIICILQVTF